ncbi:MAG: hypothetical protein IPP78_10390 [Holophagaceae bacterium]|nr:hypothetical protein [Holophagaceae bacterium]
MMSVMIAKMIAMMLWLAIWRRLAWNQAAAEIESQEPYRKPYFSMKKHDHL